MSSTTDHSRGQALAVFTLSLTAIVLAAALAFDVGQVLLERRDQQNAADAAAMAGARYILSSDTQAEQTITLPSPVTTSYLLVAVESQYTAGSNDDNWGVQQLEVFGTPAE